MKSYISIKKFLIPFFVGAFIMMICSALPTLVLAACSDGATASFPAAGEDPDNPKFCNLTIVTESCKAACQKLSSNCVYANLRGQIKYRKCKVFCYCKIQ